jgi:hypothetical protein
MSKFGKAFCFVYNKWLKTFVDQPTDPLVRFIDFFVGSGCKYCMIVRAVLLTISFFVPWQFGILIGIVVLTFTYGEKIWLCSDVDKQP